MNPKYIVMITDNNNNNNNNNYNRGYSPLGLAPNNEYKMKIQLSQ